MVVISEIFGYYSKVSDIIINEVILSFNGEINKKQLGEKPQIERYIKKAEDEV